jgi:hypothetical protein
VPARDNGIPARRFVALLDLEPQLADAMLEALRVEGVGAYAAAAPGVSGPYLDVHLPDRPKDRLWVDAEEAERARAVVRTALPELQEQYAASALEGLPEGGSDGPSDSPSDRPPDEEAAWRAIVAGYDLTGVDPVEERRADPSGESSPGRHRREASEPAETAEPAGRAEEHYVPPPPPPLPQPDAVTKLSWAAMIGGPGYLLLGTITGRGLSEQGAMLAVAAFATGFVTLVVRMKDRPPTDSGPDDGAVV